MNSFLHTLKSKKETQINIFFFNTERENYVIYGSNSRVQNPVRMLGAIFPVYHHDVE
jgi:hypothetical protein